MSNPFRYFKTSPEIFRFAVMLYVRFPLATQGPLAARHQLMPENGGAGAHVEDNERARV